MKRIPDGQSQECNKCGSVWHSYFDNICIWCSSKDIKLVKTPPPKMRLKMKASLNGFLCSLIDFTAGFVLCLSLCLWFI